MLEAGFVFGGCVLSARIAPSVRYPLQASGLLRLVCWGWVLVSTCMLALWLYEASHGGRALSWMVWCSAATAMGAAVAAAWTAARRQPSGALVWDGGQWQWVRACGDEVLLSGMHVLADGQKLLVVQAQDMRGRRHWWLLQAHWAPARWGDLRRAVYSSALVPQDDTLSS